jgi:hypothetical protein
MAGYIADPRTRMGLIALLAVRRIRAETRRRAQAAEPAPLAAEAPTQKPKRSGWFR